MRKELFHMERDVLNIGDSVTIIEGQLPFSYYYTIVPALAMSKNFAIMQKFVLGLEKIIYPWYYISDNNKIQGEVPPG